MECKEVEAMYNPFARMIAKELIEEILLESIEEIELRKVEVYGYMYIRLKDLTLTFIAQRIVIAQILKELYIGLD